MKLRNTAIALGIGAATATGLSLLKVNKDLVVGSTAVVVGAGLMIALKDKEDSNISSGRLTGKELLEKVESLGDVSKSDLVRECGYVGTKKDGGERLYFTAFYEALLEAKGVSRSAGNSEDSGEDVIEDEPTSLQLYEIGDKKFKEKDFKGAVKYFQEAYEKTYWADEGPKLDALLQVGKAKKELGDLEGACEAWNKVYESDYVWADELLMEHCGLKKPIHTWETWSEAGGEKLSEGEYKEAIYYLTEAIKVDTNTEDFRGTDEYNYKERGDAKNALGDMKGACEDWKKAAELGEEDAAKLVEENCK